MQTYSATSHTTQNRSFTIEDDGDAFQLALFVGGAQVGGGYFPEDAGGDPFALAIEIGRAFEHGPEGRSSPTEGNPAHGPAGPISTQA